MTATQANRGSGAVLDGGISLIRRTLASASDALARRKIYRNTRTELSALSNRDLRDLGIPRSDIERLAREAAYGH